MAQFGVGAFDGIGLPLVGQRRMLAGIVDQVGVGRRLVRVVLQRGRRRVEQGLQAAWLTIIGHVIGDDAARGPIYLRDDIDLFFLAPSNVYNSSSSTTGRRCCRSCGGAGGRAGKVAA